LGHETELVAEVSGVEGELESVRPGLLAGHISGGMQGIKRLVCVDQKPIGRTPRSNLATYTGLFDHVRQLFAATSAAKARRYAPSSPAAKHNASSSPRSCNARNVAMLSMFSMSPRRGCTPPMSISS